MNLYEYIDADLLLKDVTDGYISVTNHPEFPLSILNYTNKAQIEGMWDDATTKCRGLIFHQPSGSIIARPFPKFFNHDQPQAPDWKSWDWSKVDVMEKVDGSLGIIYEWGGQFYTATRGSFTSDQAIKGTEMLRKMEQKAPGFEGNFLAGETTLVEIVYPENRIVVDYKGFEGLVYLQTIDNQHGDDVSVPQAWPGRTAVEHNLTLEEALTREIDGEEGYVLYHRPTSERVKIKFAEYKRLHKLLTGVSTKTIWELLSKGQALDEILEVVPDEFYNWVTATAKGLWSEHARIKSSAWQVFCAVHQRLDPTADNFRKRFALTIKDSEYKDLLFAFLDDKDVDPMIWKRLRPTYSKPFWNQTEEVA